MAVARDPPKTAPALIPAIAVAFLVSAFLPTGGAM
jgi:hypothetical protein